MSITPRNARRSRRSVQAVAEANTTIKPDDDQHAVEEITMERLPPWKRLVIVLAFVVITICAACIIRPVERIIDVIIPQLNESETHQSQSSGWPRANNPHLTFDTTAERPTFPFRQCNTTAAQCCNGLENICDLKVNKIMFATVHNAMATKEDGYLLHPNHLFSLDSALDAGYRAIHLELCKCNNVYEFCHGICNLGAANPSEVFLNVDRFLRDNPQEVMLINLHINNNAHQTIKLKEFHQVMKNATRFSDHLYYQKYFGNDDWPTLRKMIAIDKRVLMFHDDGSTCGDRGCPRGMYHWPDYAVETEIVSGTLMEVDYMKKICVTGHENDNNIDASRKFFVVNNYLAAPQITVSAKLSEFDFISQRMAACSKVNNNLDVSLISVDFWHVGNVVEYVQRQNKARIAA